MRIQVELITILGCIIENKTIWKFLLTICPVKQYTPKELCSLSCVHAHVCLQEPKFRSWPEADGRDISSRVESICLCFPVPHCKKLYSCQKRLLKFSPFLETKKKTLDEDRFSSCDWMEAAYCNRSSADSDLRSQMSLITPDIYKSRSYKCKTVQNFCHHFLLLLKTYFLSNTNVYVNMY